MSAPTLTDAILNLTLVKIFCIEGAENLQRKAYSAVTAKLRSGKG